MDNKNVALIGVVAKAWSDPKYKERLMANPEQILAEEGVSIRGMGKIRVIDQQPDETLLLLPPKPAGELTVNNITPLVLESAAMTDPSSRVLIPPRPRNA